GGNVEGAQHDQTLILGGVQVCNVSGYPKAHPAQASQLWSEATMRFLEERNEV
ncbi:MAG: NAD(P)(+) transhydrogenase (Re/Si-specific) subunit alpha, partial [Myxococcales bacterium]|nr:NAD(P)(+) transhydrogenase (Re/Si-specific) subunit alpha [Myxococcales bacterium]